MKTKALSFSLTIALLFTAPGILNAQEKMPKYGKDSVKCIINLSLYKESFKQWKASNYKNIAVADAVKPWRYVINNCPASRQSIYLDGIKIMEWRIKKAEDDQVKDKLIDTLLMVYDRRIKYFDKEGYVLGRKGVDLYSYRPDEYEKVYNILKRSIELEGKDSYPDVLVFFMRATKKMIDEEKAPLDIIFDNYETCSKIIEHNLEVYKDDPRRKSNWENVKGNIDLTFEPYATCEALVKIYGKKFEENPEDVEMLKKMIRILDKKKCVEDPLYFEGTVKLYELEPTPESAFLIGKMLLKKNEYAEAIDYLKEGEKLEDEDDVFNSYLLLADAYKQIKQYSAARNYALKAANIKPDDGHPYLIIGDMYAESAKDCGDDDLSKKAGYWAAVDKYYKAKRVDPSLEEIANSRINTYSAYFPIKETIFFHNLNEGDEYFVECWINESTTVRAAKE